MKVREQAELAKKSSFLLATTLKEVRNASLIRAAQLLEDNITQVLTENAKDLEAAEKTGLAGPLLKRLKLSEQKVKKMAEGLRSISLLDDPLGRRSVKRELDAGLVLERVSVPIGVIGVIFESRPDALVQIAGLCMKSGNSVLLKGGKEALYSNRILFSLMRKAAEDTSKMYTGALHLVETREEIKELLEMDDLIDLMIPRGSNALVRYIQENTKIPVLGHADGICHLYIDKNADLSKAVELTHDSKCQYPAVCNALETLLVHSDVAEKVLPKIAEKLTDVLLRGDEKTRNIISCAPASEEDWSTEYTDLILSVKVVESAAEAMEHINAYGSHHTDCIVTENDATADEFLRLVDSSSVMHNASTRFADGFRYGLGAEVGISTSKIHARGPVGLEGLTTTKYILRGKGHTVTPYADGEKTFTHKDML
ncbi:MAG: glutamate-5-semialdehyde dehydrogenase [Spirochaetia bacterium]